MKALITTSFSALVIDTVAESGFVVDRGHGLYYGLAKTPDGIAIGARRRMMSSSVDRSNELGCIIFLAKDGSKYTMEAPFALRDIHGMAYFDDALWITCSLDEQIVVLKDNEWTRWYPLGPPPEPGIDKNHFNTIYVKDDLIYVLAHKFGESEVLCFDRENLSLTNRYGIGKSIHNIWFDGANMRICSSEEGKIRGDDGLSIDIGSFPRGYAEDEQYRLIGTNEYAPRAMRDLTDGSLILTDKDYNVIKKLRIPQEGLVLDILHLTDLEYGELKLHCLSDETIAIENID